jgi:hypothetical protein
MAQRTGYRPARFFPQSAAREYQLQSACFKRRRAAVNPVNRQTKKGEMFKASRLFAFLRRKLDSKALSAST